jgi:aminoglycoside phosphotransferase (APT) family kinase protein
MPVELDADLVRAVVRDAVGQRTEVRVDEWFVRDDDYVVVALDTLRPALRLVVKLEVAGTGRDHHLEHAATIARLVRAQTEVPTCEVIAVDVTGSRWPCRVLISTELPGVTWARLYPMLTEEGRAVGQRQLGRATAQLHALAFDYFGAIGATPIVGSLRYPLDALRLRARERIRSPESRELMLEVLERHADWFQSASGPRLTHEDLNPNNLLFEIQDDRPVLTGVLDFESAWAGVAESDLARLELWWLTRGAALRAGHAEIAPVPDDYLLRRPILQLLWCLEYADYHTSAAHEADTNVVLAELGLSPRGLPAPG